MSVLTDDNMLDMLVRHIREALTHTIGETPSIEELQAQVDARIAFIQADLRPEDRTLARVVNTGPDSYELLVTPRFRPKYVNIVVVP